MHCRISRFIDLTLLCRELLQPFCYDMRDRLHALNARYAAHTAFINRAKSLSGISHFPSDQEGWFNFGAKRSHAHNASNARDAPAFCPGACGRNDFAGGWRGGVGGMRELAVKNRKMSRDEKP